MGATWMACIVYTDIIVFILVKFSLMLDGFVKKLERMNNLATMWKSGWPKRKPNPKLMCKFAFDEPLSICWIDTMNVSMLVKIIQLKRKSRLQFLGGGMCHLRKSTAKLRNQSFQWLHFAFNIGNQRCASNEMLRGLCGQIFSNQTKLLVCIIRLILSIGRWHLQWGNLIFKRQTNHRLIACSCKFLLSRQLWMKKPIT